MWRSMEHGLCEAARHSESHETYAVFILSDNTQLPVQVRNCSPTKCVEWAKERTAGLGLRPATHGIAPQPPSPTPSPH